jgi:adenylate kinase family enzyme
MLTKLFVFGLPGSGKSTVSRSIVDHVHRHYKQWSAQRVCDYNILYEMFRRDTKKKDFYPVKHQGFYVTNPSMYDIVLKNLEKFVNDVSPKGHKLLLIEFSRGDYAQALKNFGSSFFDNAAYLYLQANTNTCLKRIAERVKNPQNIDDHYVPDRTFDRFVEADTEEYPQTLCNLLVNSYGGKNKRFLVINSTGSKDETILQANTFADEIIRDGYLLRDWEVASIRTSGIVTIEYATSKYVLALP